MNRVRLSFEPSGQAVSVPSGVSVFEAAGWNGIAIDSTCGGQGTCKKCRVRVTGGAPPESASDARAFTPAQLDDGWRLACLARADHDLTVEVPPLSTRPKAATIGVGRQVILRPAVQKRHVTLGEPSLDDQTPDMARLLAAIDDLDPRPDLHALRRCGPVMRASAYDVTAVIVGDRLIDVEPGDTTDRRYGIAFDLGTTTVVATLLDLSTGTPVAAASALNRQHGFGADVISRISATMLSDDALPKLRTLAQETLDALVHDVCTAVDPREVYEIALAGNATMIHIVLGIDPEPLGVAPFIQASSTFDGLLASDLGVGVHPRAPAVALPSLGAYVGGDILAGALASGMDRDRRLRLFIDVGTNCEIVLGSADSLIATAAPAGPAFEGGQIRCGMRAEPGAIESVRLARDGIKLGVIGDAPPHGICGSGLVDAVAELLRAGHLDASGRLVSGYTEISGERAFELASDIYLFQRDIRELQFAKAAIATGWRLLLEEHGVRESDIQQVLLAGSFGSYLSPASAVRIGLVPALALPRIVSAGNVAGEGAKLVLLSAQERAGATALLQEVKYVELSDRPDFNDRFVDLLAFP